MMNNEEAVLNVSSNIPIGTKTVTDANQLTTTQFEFKDVELKLPSNHKLAVLIVSD